MSNNAGSPDNSEKSGTKRGGLFIIAIVIAGMVYLSRHEAVNTIDCNAEVLASKPDVIMLGAWWCSYCYQAKKYFQRNNIHYCEYDMENTPEGKQLYEKHGGGAIPIMLIGKYQLSGFDRHQIETAIAANNRKP